jgi:hypothetical protein
VSSVLDVAKLLWDGEEMGACLPAESASQVLLAALDLTLRLLCEHSRSGDAGTVLFFGRISSNVTPF